MKLPSLIVCFIFIAIISPAVAAERINSFEARLLISSDGQISVEEDIEYQFTDKYRHGIIRNIPYRYRLNGNNYNLDIEVLNITDFSGKTYSYQVTKNSHSVNIKIGDPDKQITGIHQYRIEYFVRRAVIFEEGEDVFYWNITGNEWKVPVMNSSARIYFDQPGIDMVKAECFTGGYGSEQSECGITHTSEGLKVASAVQLWGGDGLTVRLYIPKGLIEKPSFVVSSYYFLRDNKSFSLPFVALLLLGLVWNYSGRDPLRGAPVAVRYSPPDDMSPAEAGSLYDEKADIIDLTSTIVDLAVRGYIKIEEIETTKFLFLTDRDYRLVRLRSDYYSELKNFEIEILNGLFNGGKKEVMVSDLKNKFYRKLDGIKKSLYSALVKKGYFLTNPERVRGLYSFAGMFIIAGGFFLFRDFTTVLMTGLSGVLVIVFSRFMPRKTRKGAETKHHLAGFRDFIERAEKDRIRLLASEDPLLFERMLPFALVFGLEEKWAGAFSDIFTKPPEWYVSPGRGSAFNSHVFVNDLGRSISVMNKSLFSSPQNSGGGRGVSMSGGGFSGGGFGGGGGGSW